MKVLRHRACVSFVATASNNKTSSLRGNYLVRFSVVLIRSCLHSCAYMVTLRVIPLCDWLSCVVLSLVDFLHWVALATIHQQWRYEPNNGLADGQSWSRYWQQEERDEETLLLLLPSDIRLRSTIDSSTFHSAYYLLRLRLASMEHHKGPQALVLRFIWCSVEQATTRHHLYEGIIL